MGENEPIKYSDLLQPDSSFEDLIALVETLGTKYSELLQTIKTSAASIKSSVSAANVTLKAGQDAIKASSKEADALARKEQELKSAYSDAAKELVKVNLSRQKQKQIMKLEEKMATSAVGSYDYLSAAYNKNKIELNAMSEEVRKNTKEGQELEKQTLALYQKMKELQEVTGKHTLSVGEYGQATVYLASDIRRGVQALTQMRVEGKAGTAQYKQLSNELKVLKRQYAIVKTETQSLGSQTAELNQVMGAQLSMSGLLTAATGFMADADNDWGKSLVWINKSLAITNGLIAFQNGLYKQSAITMFIASKQQKAQIRARALNIKLLNQETKATWVQATAQTVLNAIASANPYFILAAALIALTGIIIGLVTATKDYTKRLIEQNAAIKKQAELIAELREVLNQPTKFNIENIEQYIQYLQSLGNSEIEVMNWREKILKRRKEMYERDSELYKDETQNLEENNAELERLAKIRNDIQEKALQEALTRKSGKPRRRVTLDEDFFIEELRGKNVNRKKLQEVLDGMFENVKAKVEVGMEIRQEGANLENDVKKQIEEAWKLQQDFSKAEADAQQKTIRERFNARDAAIKLQYDYEIAALKHRLETEEGLTVGQVEHINALIVSLTKQKNNDLADLNYDRIKANRDAIRASEDLEQKAIQESYNKRVEAVKTSYAREREDIQLELKHNASLTKKEREELAKQLILIDGAEKRELTDLQHEQYLKELSLYREYEDTLLDAKTEGYAKQLEQLEVAHAREKEDIQDRLNFEALTEKERETLMAQLIAADKRYAKQRRDIEIELERALKQNDKTTWENRLSYLNQYTTSYLVASRNIIKANEDLELSEFRLQAQQLGLSPEKVLEGEQQIRKKYQDEDLKNTYNWVLARLDLYQELEESEFHIVERSSYQNTKFERQQQIERYRALLKLDDMYGNKLTDTERQIIENRIKALQNASNNPQNVWDWLGLPPEWEDLLSEWADKMMEAYQRVLDARKELADAMVSASEKEVTATQSALDAELEARANGYASNAALAKKELAEAKARQREALAEQQKVAQAQERLDTITQISDLITATSTFWKTSSKLGPVAGPIAATAATATMFAAFLASKIEANRLKKQAATYGEGTVELLRGGSHASGHDISLGTTPDGRQRRAEGGEYFIIINRRNAKKYGELIPEVANAFNDGTFEDKFTRGNLIKAVEPSDNSVQGTLGIYELLRTFTNRFGTTEKADLSRLEKDVAALKNFARHTEYTQPNGTRVVRDGNRIRRITNG